MQDLASIASSPRRIRQSNEIAVLRALHEFRRLSRADLARHLRLNRSSSGHIIAGLMEEGLVRELEEPAEDLPGRRRAGRPGILLELVPEAVLFVGLEIGVEHVSVVELDLGAAVVRSVQRSFDGPATPVQEAVRGALGLAFDGMPPDRLRLCEGLGLATPSQMDRNGVVRVAPLLGWANVDLIELVRQALPAPVPVMVENDANALAIGATYGQRVARTGVTLVLNMETGVGGGILIEGSLFRGANGLAGEIGHLRLDLGAEGAASVEERIGLERILAEYAERCRLPQPRLADLLRDVRDREPGAVAVAEGWARTLAYALVQACRMIDADKVVLGGSVAALYPLVAARVQAHLKALQEPSFPLPTISVHEDADFGAAFGAACMLHQRFLSLESHRFADGPQEVAAERV